MSVDSLIDWAWHSGVDISTLIVLVLVCRRPFVNLFGARAAYALWALPVIRLILPQTPMTLPRPDWLPNWTQVTTNTPTEIISAPMIEVTASNTSSSPVNWHLPFIAIWLFVTALWLLHQLWRQHQYMKTVQENCTHASEEIHDKLNDARQTLTVKTVPTLRISRTNTGPLVGGVFKPVIVLPHNFETDFTPRQQYLALTHELAHIKRGDLLAAFGALVFRALNWPNPLVHLAAAKFRADQEAACDAYVLNIIGGGAQTKQNYAATLIHAAKLTRISARTPTAQAPLCLTIYHPLKERLMTMKTSKTGAGLLARLGVSAFLVAALAATAPISFAGNPKTDPETKTKTVEKKVIKWVENVDGVETTKQYEITKEDGVTKAYSIDENGNKTEIDASEIEMAGQAGGMNMFIADGQNDEFGEKGMKVFIEREGDPDQKAFKIKVDGDMDFDEGTHSKVIIKRLSKNEDGTIVDMDNDVMVFAGDGQGSEIAAMVDAAKNLIDRADDSDLSNKARRKLEKARKALKEAQEAIAADE